MKTRQLALMALLALALFVIGCSGDDNVTDNNGDITTGENQIGPAGGTVEITGKISLNIPAGALTDTITFTINQNGSPTAPPGTRGLVSPAYTIGPAGTSFSSDATLTIVYSEASLGGADEGTIVLCGDSGSGWEDLVSTVNTGGNTVSADISHLSDFSAMVDTSSYTEGVFARLIVSRMIVFMGYGDPLRTDGYEALIDSAYAPCDPISPYQTLNITCEGQTLVWSSNLHFYIYPEIPDPMSPFITLGNVYDFNVAAGSGVSALSESIAFPTSEPYVTSPTYMSTVNKSGFTTNWAGSGSGVVELMIINMGGDSAIFLETANDGSHTFSSSDLSGLIAGNYSLILNHYNRETFVATGYDSRSFIAARVMSTTLFTLAD
ncbi:MAG: hypothetical protein GY841_09575 [FCB group bacterium]|nr:hypothetical protein [FCB group bacterium]